MRMVTSHGQLRTLQSGRTLDRPRPVNKYCTIYHFEIRFGLEINMAQEFSGELYQMCFTKNFPYQQRVAPSTLRRWLGLASAIHNFTYFFLDLNPFFSFFSFFFFGN